MPHQSPAGEPDPATLSGSRTLTCEHITLTGPVRGPVTVGCGCQLAELPNTSTTREG